MKKILQNIRYWRMCVRRRTYMNRLIEERRKALDAVQVKEYRGKLYLAVNDVPVLDGNYIDGFIPTALNKAREAYVSYRMDNIRNQQP